MFIDVLSNETDRVLIHSEHRIDPPYAFLILHLATLGGKRGVEGPSPGGKGGCIVETCAEAPICPWKHQPAPYNAREVEGGEQGEKQLEHAAFFENCIVPGRERERERERGREREREGERGSESARARERELRFSRAKGVRAVAHYINDYHSFLALASTVPVKSKVRHKHKHTHKGRTAAQLQRSSWTLIRTGPRTVQRCYCLWQPTVWWSW